jgi:NhaP-type Na+/H+ or K+/H+ antiporter
MDTNLDWKKKTFLKGIFGGAALGALSAYLYARAAEESLEEGEGEPEGMNTAQVLSLSLAAMGLLRQFVESGKPKKK